MQNKEISARDQHIIEHLEDSWKLQQELSPEKLRQITELVVGIKEPYRNIGLKIIAEHIVNEMSLHILDIMSTFQQKAEEEGISSEDYKETVDYILPRTFRVLNELIKQVSIQSLDDVATLSNITISLQTPSDTDTAHEAQSLLYELPIMYYSQLTYEHLVAKELTDWTLHETVQDIGPSMTLKMNIPVDRVLSTPISIELNNIHYLPAA